MAERHSIAASSVEVRAADTPTLDIQAEVAALERMTPKQLKDKFADAFGEEARSNNRVWLIKRIAWRIQANAYGGLSERALQRARELANDADLRLKAPNATVTAARMAAVSAPGPQFLINQALKRKYKGRMIVAYVRDNGFEWDNTVYPSLSAVAKAVTGSPWGQNTPPNRNSRWCCDLRSRVKRSLD